MFFTTVLAASLPILGSLAAPLPGTPTTDSPVDVAARACAPISSPTAPYTVVAIKPNSPIHYLALNAGPDNRLVLGGDADATVCPLADQSLCPPGAYTVFTGFGSLYVSVPGGQQTYAAANGHLGFTVPHSAAVPAGAVLDPFTYDKADQCNSDHGTISTAVHGAKGLMACPTMKNTRNPNNQWRVFANFPGAHPPTGSKADCIPFQAFAFDYADEGSYKAAAWSYA